MGIQRVSYTHDSLIDLIVENPCISQNELAARFGYTPGWVSQVVNSDAFRERLAQRREEVVDPVLRMSLEERIRGVVDKSLPVLLEKLETTGNPNIAIRVLEHGSRALGYGAQQKQAVVVQNYVAIVPPKSLDSASWSEAHAPAPTAPFKAAFSLDAPSANGGHMPRVLAAARVETNADATDVLYAPVAAPQE
jgi:hypothetical protein